VLFSTKADDFNIFVVELRVSFQILFILACDNDRRSSTARTQNNGFESRSI
jgi:hypothetical protein